MKKRADGRYCKQILVGFHPDGRRKMVSIYGMTIKEVEKKEREIRQQIDDGIKIDAGLESVLLKEWAMEWLEVYKAPNVEYATYDMYKRAINGYIIPIIGNIQLKKVATIHIQRLLNLIIGKGNIRTAEICKLTIKQIMKQAVCNRMIQYDPTLGLQQIKKDNKEKQPLSDFEKKAIELSELSLKERIFIDIMRYTGLRRGEAMALTTDDFNSDVTKLMVKNSLAFIDNGFKLKCPKSPHSKRTIPIPKILTEELRTYISRMNGNKLFTSKKGEYMTKSSFRKFWKGIMKKVSVAAQQIRETDELYVEDVIRFTPHICRHTYATDLYYSGVDVKTAQYLLGHASINITLDIYTHLDMLKLCDSIDEFDNYLSQSKISQNIDVDNDLSIDSKQKTA